MPLVIVANRMALEKIVRKDQIKKNVFLPDLTLTSEYRNVTRWLESQAAVKVELAEMFHQDLIHISISLTLQDWRKGMASQIKESLTQTIVTQKEETYFDALSDKFLTADDKATNAFKKHLDNSNCPMDFCAKDAPV